MSWLFGRKKKDSPPESSTEEEQQDPGDNFIFIEKNPQRPAPPPPNTGDGTPYPPSGLYPALGGATPYPTNPETSADCDSSQDPPHYLAGVPFKLCKQLEREVNDDLEIDRLRIGEILSFIERIGNQNYDYEFELERSVIAEMDSTNSGE